MTALGTDIEEVVMGSQHACARKKDGAVWCWGDNSSGQLGRGDLMPNDSPSLVRGIDSQPQKLVAGRNFACVLGRDHKVYCWGKNEIGALGKLGLGARPTPFLLSELGTETAALYAAHDQLCAHTTDGKLLCQGLVAQNGGALTSQTPLLVDGLPRDVAEVSFGLHDACARMQSGALWCWGERLRQSDTDPNVKVKRPPGPQLVPGLSDVASVHLGDYYLCARSKTGSVYCWGDGTGGALGAGRITVSERPIRVPLSCTE
jgi:alpha-tubulin suppressor-like RCC1 family protein